MKWDQNNPEKVKDFIAKMKQDYAFKKAYAARRPSMKWPRSWNMADPSASS